MSETFSRYNERHSNKEYNPIRIFQSENDGNTRSILDKKRNLSQSKNLILNVINDRNINNFSLVLSFVLNDMIRSKQITNVQINE